MFQKHNFDSLFVRVFKRSTYFVFKIFFTISMGMTLDLEKLYINIHVCEIYPIIFYLP